MMFPRRLLFLDAYLRYHQFGKALHANSGGRFDTTESGSNEF